MCPDWSGVVRRSFARISISGTVSISASLLCVEQSANQSSDTIELVRRRAARARRLAVAIDPGVRDSELVRRNDVVEVALGGVQPRCVADPLSRFDEVRVPRLIRPHLLRGADQIEI